MANKGFGGAKSKSSQSAKQFILSLKKYWEANPDSKNDHQFFSSHLSELNESLLKSLSSVFRDLTKNKKTQDFYQIASLYWNFGVSIAQFPLGDISLNIELSIVAFQIALEFFTSKTFPEKWATLQNNLGAAYCERIRGERTKNLEQSISCHESALQVFTYDAFPENWAGTQNNLGIVYTKRIKGNRADNFEQSIAALQLALKIFTRDSFPNEWASAQDNLGSAYWECIRGDRADNLERAISAYKLALQVKTIDTSPKVWAGIQNNLGNAYRERIRGERADNVEEAITVFKQALQIFTLEDFPPDWALLQNNLGLAYKDRIQGDRESNIEEAIAAFNLALQVRTRNADPEEWAKTQHNLAKAYRDRISGDRIENLEQAIELFNQAAQVFTREDFPEKWSINQAHLAEALIKRSALKNNCIDLDTAIELLQSALELAVVGSPDYIDTNHRLGNAFSRRYEHTKNATELEQAMQAYKIALDAISPEHYDRKQIWQALPTTQVILGSRLVSDGQWQEGLQLLLNSLTQLSTGDDQLAHANALYQTGRAYEIMSDLDKARLYYRDALRLYDHLNDALGTTQSRAGLGSVLVSQGHLEKGISELAQAREGYLQLERPEQAHDLDSIYQAAQRALERQNPEVYA
jgi:tetratricopeptide (TPR) repeat protein